MDEGSLRAQCSEAPHPGTAAGKEIGIHLFLTAPSMSHRTTTPHLTLLLWKSDVIVNVKSYKMVQNLLFAKTNHGRVLLVLFLCSRASDPSPWCIILLVRTPQNGNYLFCGICWHVWGLAPGLHRECMQETEQPSDCGGKQGPFLTGCREAWQITKCCFMGLSALLCYFSLSSCLQMLAAGDKLSSQL